MSDPSTVRNGRPMRRLPDTKQGKHWRDKVVRGWRMVRPMDFKTLFRHVVERGLMLPSIFRRVSFFNLSSFAWVVLILSALRIVSRWSAPRSLRPILFPDQDSQFYEAKLAEIARHSLTLVSRDIHGGWFPDIGQNTNRSCGLANFFSHSLCHLKGSLWSCQGIWTASRKGHNVLIR